MLDAGDIQVQVIVPDFKEFTISRVRKRTLGNKAKHDVTVKLCWHGEGPLETVRKKRRQGEFSKRHVEKYYGMNVTYLGKCV